MGGTTGAGTAFGAQQYPSGEARPTAGSTSPSPMASQPQGYQGYMPSRGDSMYGQPPWMTAFQNFLAGYQPTSPVTPGPTTAATAAPTPIVGPSPSTAMPTGTPGNLRGAWGGDITPGTATPGNPSGLGAGNPLATPMNAMLRSGGIGPAPVAAPGVTSPFPNPNNPMGGGGPTGTVPGLTPVTGPAGGLGYRPTPPSPFIGAMPTGPTAPFPNPTDPMLGNPFAGYIAQRPARRNFGG
jgi:hypothetical protein